MEVHVLSLEGLLKAKRAAGRPKDLAGIKELEALLELRKKPARVDVNGEYPRG